MNVHLPSSLFFENEAATHKLQPSSQNPLSFVHNFCQGLTSATEFLRSYAHPINTHDHLAEPPNFCAPGKSLVRACPKSLGSYRFLFGHVRSYPRELFVRITFIVTTPVSVLDGCEWPASRPSPLTPGQGATSTYGKGGWVSPTASLNSLQKEKSLAPTGCPASSLITGY